jgi:hypothetical protein
VSHADYPDRYDENRDSVAAVLARTTWLAFLDTPLVVEDLRAPHNYQHQELRTTVLDLVDFVDGTAHFALLSIGNDDVPGRCCHEVGRLFLLQHANDQHPFRDGTDEVPPLPELVDSTIAAVALGFGVLATNAALRERSGGTRRGYMVQHEWSVERAGGLDYRELAFLLAVQVVVRGDQPDALESRLPTQAELVEGWRDELMPHRDELRARLRLDALDSTAPQRPALPRRADVRGEVDEGDLYSPNLGTATNRVTHDHRGLGLAISLPLTPALATSIVALARAPNAAIALTAMFGVVYGPLLGWIVGKRFHYPACGHCARRVKRSATTCWYCGGTFVTQGLDRQQTNSR